MVWSDPQIQELARTFLPVAEEVHFLYPEDQWSLNRVKDNPAHLFFKAFGERVPKADWHHPGTKQGIYAMSPDGDFLTAMFASPGPEVVRTRLKEAIERWEKLKRERSYAEKPVPVVEDLPPSEVASKPMILRVSLRDLPSGKGDARGQRYESKDRSGEIWPDFVKWAWNQNWIAFDRPDQWITTSAEWTALPSSVSQRVAREVLIDNVRGQTGQWDPQHVKKAHLEVRKANSSVYEYRGDFQMDSGFASYACKVYGEAKFDSQKNRFQSFEMVATGMRRGAFRFNQRENDQGPAPMGVSLSLYLR